MHAKFQLISASENQFREDFHDFGPDSAPAEPVFWLQNRDIVSWQHRIVSWPHRMWPGQTLARPDSGPARFWPGHIVCGQDRFYVVKTHSVWPRHKLASLKPEYKVLQGQNSAENHGNGHET